MSFFESRNGILYPINRIDSIVRGKKAKVPGGVPTPARVRMIDGESIEIWPFEVDAIRKASAAIIPAGAGQYLLSYYYDPSDEADPGPYVHMEPILGWRQDSEYGGVNPVMLDPNFETMEPHQGMLDQQTGRVYHPTEGNYPDQQTWEGAVKASIDGAHERAKAKPVAAPVAD